LSFGEVGLDRRTRSVDEGFFPQNVPHLDENIPAELLLVIAVLRQAVADARQPRPHPSKVQWKVSVQEQREAVEFLRSEDELALWAGMLNKEPSWLRKRLAEAAGLLDPAPRNDQPTGPAPRTKTTLYAKESPPCLAP